MIINGWQRIWVIFALVTFVLSVIYLYLNWPTPRVGVLKDLANPACEYIKKLPDGFTIDQIPTSGECSELGFVRFVISRSVVTIEDYKELIRTSKIRASGTVFGLWLLGIALVYGVGWAVSWVRAGFQKSSRPNG